MSFTQILENSRSNPEDWRYTDLRALTDVVFTGAAKPALDLDNVPARVTNHRITFVSGCYRPDLSSVANLPAGLLTACDDGICEMHAEKEHCLALAPVEILYLWPEESRPTESRARLVLSLGESARLTLLERHVGTAETQIALQDVQTQIRLDPQAKLVHGKIVSGAPRNYHFAQTMVHAAKGAFYDRVAYVHGGALVRCETEADLNGEMAETRMLAVKLLNGDSRAHTLLRVRHNAPHGVSRQLVKTVLSDKAKASFQGAIHVAQAAQKTDAHQLGRALLLSNSAEMNAKPELEIYADDVKCSHGSTIGDLDETALFYLRSRGIAADQARAMLVRAFVEDIVDQVQSPEIAQAIATEMERAL